MTDENLITIKYGGQNGFYSHRLPDEVQPGDEVDVPETDADYLCKYDYFMQVSYDESDLEDGESE